MREGFGFQSAGQKAMARRRLKHQTDMYRCTPLWRSICASGTRRRPTPRTRILFFHRSRRRAACLSPPPFLSADHLRPAAILAGVQIEKGQRFGLHNLRHSLSNWLVNKAKVEPKTVQGILRHSRIQTTLDLYTQERQR